MSNIDQEQLGEWLSAYLDGELNPEQKELVDRLLREDESARRLLDDLRRTVDLVSSLPRHSAPGSLAQDVQLHVERSELLGEPEETPVRSGGRRAPFVAVLSMAAALGLFAVGLRIIVTDGALEPELGESIVALAPDQDRDRLLADLAEEEVASRPKKGRGHAKGPRREARPTREAAMREAVADSSLTSDQPMDRGEVANLVATADFSRKIRAGLGTESISTHAFANETVRLRVVARDEADRDAITDKVVAYLAGRRAADLAVAMTDESDRTVPSSSYYYRGAPGINYVEPREQQVLVRASRRELEGMMDELERHASATESVALVAGPLSIHGLGRARTALYGLGEPEPAVTDRRGLYFGSDKAEAEEGEPGETSATPPDITPARVDDLFDDLLETVGLEPEKLTGLPAPKPDVAPADPSTSEPVVLAKAKKAEADNRLVTPVPTGARDASTRAGGRRGRGDEALTLEEPPSLVERRLKELKMSRRGAKPVEPSEGPGMEGTTAAPEMPAAVSPGETLGTQPDEPYVTLIVQVMVAEPEPRRPARAGRPAKSEAKAQDKKSRKSRAAE
ncbi:MAG: hypothetical protein JSU86_16300 [Phycisphaerales bacterium]|nr:MAG: hypothetical protein JSU86_16300 [Phycisphaerales bacterium]